MIKKLFLFSLYIYIILVNYLTCCDAKISDKRLCADPQCSSVLSYATTLLQYFPSEKCMVQFPPNVKVSIFAKSAGERKDLWEIEYNGKRGYAPASLLRETKIVKKKSDLVFEVPTQCGNEEKTDVVVEQPKVEVPIVPASAVEPFEMIDGTKVFNEEVANKSDEITHSAEDDVNVVETPSLPPATQPPLEDKSNELNISVDDPKDDDYQEDDYADEEEVMDDNEVEDDESEETVSSDETGRVILTEPKNESDEILTESIVSENILNEVESEIKTEENETMSEDIEEIKPENVPPSSSPETIQPPLEEPSKFEEINTEPPQNLFVTENPNEIPRPILENQNVSEITTPTPFLVPITANMPKETISSSSETNYNSEENSTKSQEITSETPSVPSVEENNGIDEDETFYRSTEPEKPLVLNVNGPKLVEEPTLINENPVSPPPPRFDETLPPKLPELLPINIDNKLEEIGQDLAEETNKTNEPASVEEEPAAIKAEIPLALNVNGPKLVEEPTLINENPVSPPPPRFDETLPPKLPEILPINIDNKLEEIGQEKFEKKSEPENSSELNVVGPEPIEEPVIVNEIPVSYPPPPPPPDFETPPVKLPEIVDEQSVTEIPLTHPSSAPEISTSVIQTLDDSDSTPPAIQENQTPTVPDESEPQSPGLFASIYAKMFGLGKGNEATEDKQNIPLDEELKRILYPEKFRNNPDSVLQQIEQESYPSKPTDVPSAAEGYCENLSPNSCPQSAPSSYPQAKLPVVSHFHSAHSDAIENCTNAKGIDYEEYLKIFLDGIIKMKDFIIYLTITATTVLAFMFGYYCINNCRKESPLINNLNVLERNLMVSRKENVLLQGDLDDTRQKLASIEDNSFGSNEMVIALKTQLEDSENQRNDLQLQVAALEKELESATEDGFELNRMVAELLNNQSGSESIISSVEELQRQLNEQQETIQSINTTLAEKSRENSELQVFLNNQNKQFDEDLQMLQSQNQNLTESNRELSKKIIEMTETLEVTVNEALKSKSDEIIKLHKELGTVKKRSEDSQRKLAKVESRCQVVDEYLKNAKNDAPDAKHVYDLVQLKSDALAANKEKELFRERLEGETDARKLVEDHLKVVSEEVSNLKKQYNVAEKEKVEAQTRLEVLSGYFKEKEIQLQKELSVKEALSLQQQGEKTSTIERVQSLQDEIQNLKSQNDALRAEIEAQAAAHKTQITTLDSRAHEEWLNAKQANRKLEEVRSEAAGLRRKLTTFGESGVDGTGLANGIDGNLNAPSPILMVGDNSAGASMLGVLPPPPFMPPPFMGPPPPFMPPPFMPGEMRPPPLGRLMSPPPNRYSPNIIDDRDRYSPNRSLGRYSPDARYNYNDVLSPYETETDFSPPPSPPPRHGGYRDNRGYKAYSPPPSQPDNRNKKSKGGLSSGSTDSLPRRRGGGDNAGPNKQNGSNKV